MLYFSKLRIFFVSVISLFFILVTSSNLFKFDNDLLNKKINLGSENNIWVLENGMIFLKEKNQALNKAIFLRKIP